MISCPRCHSQNIIKRGIARGKQRWLCKECKYQFTRMDQTLGKPQNIKQQAVKLYCSGLSFRAIGNLLNVSFSAVYRWVRKAGVICRVKTEKSKEPIVVELDEFWHFVKKKPRNAGSSKQWKKNQDV